MKNSDVVLLTLEFLEITHVPEVRAVVNGWTHFDTSSGHRMKPESVGINCAWPHFAPLVMRKRNRTIG